MFQRNLENAYELTGVYANSNYDTSTRKIRFSLIVTIYFSAVWHTANVTDFNKFFALITVDESPDRWLMLI